MTDLSALGILVPEVLLPEERVDLTRWAVIASDQYTSDLDYWERVEQFVGDQPSTLRLFLPEAFLGAPDVDDRIEKIQDTMRRYQKANVFRPPLRGLISVDRRTEHVPSRKGLVVALDLERYDYREGATTLIRATEKTVEERLPPRVRVRQGAELELPHVMVLIDDPECRVIEPIDEAVQGKRPLYEGALMEGGGSIRGHAVEDAALLERVAEGLSRLAAPAAFRAKYGVDSDDVLLFAMGDGNHSLAAAKLHWETLKPKLEGRDRMRHPARHALVELVNVHDLGLQFEPIHRVVFGVSPVELLDAVPAYYERQGARAEARTVADEKEQRGLLERAWKAGGDVQTIGFKAAERRGIITVQNAPSHLAVGTLQGFLDDWASNHRGVTMDYIHGADVVDRLSSDPDRVGFYLPNMAKSDLFKTVLVDGALPRKTFSMGEADEKRFYLEARRIV